MGTGQSLYHQDGGDKSTSLAILCSSERRVRCKFREKGAEGAELVKCLPCKNEDLRLVPRNQMKKAV